MSVCLSLCLSQSVTLRLCLSLFLSLCLPQCTAAAAAYLSEWLYRRSCHPITSMAEERAAEKEIRGTKEHRSKGKNTKEKIP